MPERGGESIVLRLELFYLAYLVFLLTVPGIDATSILQPCLLFPSIQLHPYVGVSKIVTLVKLG